VSSAFGNTTFSHEQYMVLEELGRGGMGIVYRARDRKLMRDVAIKVIAWNLSDDEVIRFHKEAKALALLQHPNILGVQHFGHSDDDSLFLVMELLTGRSLSELLEAEKHPPFEDALDIFMQICDGLSHAHGKGILHRDIKPSNVFVARYAAGEFKVTITDFGLAKLLTEDQHQTKTNISMGSPPYMSPEQCAGKPVDQRSDIYGLGCLMFEVLTGTRPFQAETIPALMMQHLKEEPPTLHQRAQDRNYPPEMERIIEKCLAKNPAERYAKAKDLKADLKVLRDSIVNVSFDSGDSGVYSPSKSFLRTGAFIITGFQNLARPSQEKKFMLIIGMTVAIVGVLGALALYKMKPAKFEINYTPSTPTWAMNGTETSQNMTVSSDVDDEDNLFKMKSTATVNEPGRVRENTIWIPVEENATASLESIANKTNTAMKLMGAEMAPNWLDLSGSDVSDEDLKIIEELPIRGLKLNNTKITDAGLATVGKISSMVELYLDGTKITDAGIQQLGNCRKLEMLTLSNTAISDAIHKPLNACGKLAYLRLDNCKNYHGSKLNLLHDNYDLFHLSLRGSGLKKENLNRLKDVELPNLDLSNLNLTDEDCVLIASVRIPKLESLSINRNPEITDKGLRALAKIKHLVTLSINGCDKVTANGIEQFHIDHTFPPAVVFASHLKKEPVKPVAEKQP
jgi:serine/threonine protein kinase